MRERHEPHSPRDIFERFAVAGATLRLWEEIGLLQPSRPGDAHPYGPKDLTRIEVILKGQQLGFSLDDIKLLVGVTG